MENQGQNNNVVNNMSNGMNNNQTVQYNNNINNIPEEYKPISMWGYFGYQLLFSIPCVGIICLLIFSLGGTKNINLKNYARSYFCYIIVMAILFAIFFALGFFGAVTYNNI